MKIDVDELIKILPQLIRENDAIKGAILSALSGVVATREDIKEIIREMDRRFEGVDRRFETMQQQMDKRFEAMQQQMDKRFDMVHTEIADLTRVIGLLKGFLEKNITQLQERQDKVERFMGEMRDFMQDLRDRHV